MKSVIGLLLGLAVIPATAENATTGQTAAATVTPAALLKSVENAAARNHEASGMLAPPPENDSNLALNPGQGTLLPAPPPFQPSAAKPVDPPPPASAAQPAPALPIPK